MECERKLTDNWMRDVIYTEVEKLEELREEHRRVMECERKLMDNWMRDVKERLQATPGGSYLRVGEDATSCCQNLKVEAALTTRTHPTKLKRVNPLMVVSEKVN